MSDGAKLLVPILLVLYALSWLIALAGLAAVQDIDIVSSWALSLQWFILWLQLLVIIAIPLLSVMGLLKRLRASMIGMLAIMSTIWLWAANEAYHVVRGPSVNKSRWNTLVAGACMLFITNVFAMFLIDFDGSDDSSVIDAAPTKGGSTPAPVTVVQVPESKGSPAVSV
jgi:polyferredoxin